METNISRIFSFMKENCLKILSRFRQNPNKNLSMRIYELHNFVTMSLISVREGSTQSEKTQNFCFANFATLYDSRSKLVSLFNTAKRTLCSKI